MSVKGKLIQYQLDEIFFHLSDRIWFLMMLEVFPQQGIDTISSNVIILRALKYIFSTLRVQECIKLEEMDDVLNYFMGGKKDAKTVRGVREQIVGYDHTQKYELYEELYLEHECLEPVIQKLNKRHKKTEDLFQKILEHINESYQKMRFDNIKEYLMIRGTYIRKPAGPAGLVPFQFNSDRLTCHRPGAVWSGPCRHQTSN